MAQYLYHLKPSRADMLCGSGPTAEESNSMARHVDYLQKLCEAGTVKLAGRTANDDEKTFGIVLLDVADEDKAQRIMRDDPAVSDGVMNAQLYPFRVALGDLAD